MNTLLTLEDNVRMVYEEAAAKILRYTPVLYTRLTDGSKKIEPLGSSVLLTNGRDHFLLTAAHCVEQDNVRIKFAIHDRGKLHFICGDLLYHLKKDMAVVRLTAASTQACLRNFSFLSTTQVLQNRWITTEQDYLIVGYPVSNVVVDQKKKRTRRKALVLISKSKSKLKYDRTGFSQHTNRLLGYDRKHSSFLDENVKNFGPEPKGISGCGLWFIPSYFTESLETVEVRLSGIMIEYYREQNMMVSVNIELLMDMIALWEKNETNDDQIKNIGLI